MALLFTGSKNLYPPEAVLIGRYTIDPFKDKYMNYHVRVFSFFFISAVMIHLSCKKETSCEGCVTKNNKPPIAVAGPDRIITLPTDSVLLDGSSSNDPDGSISSYLWKKISGPSSFTIFKPSDSITQVRTLAAGVYQFELKVTDDGGLSARDTMGVIVDAVITTNHPPIARAGPDQTITLPTNTVNLDGSASSDPENNISSYGWRKISGPSPFTIVNSNAVQTQVTNLIQGIYQFELGVFDAPGLFSKDTMEIIVSAAVSNLRPVAIAGSDTIIQTNQTSCTPVPMTITLNGSKSYDADGSITSYFWSGSNGIANANSAITTVTGTFYGTIAVILKVTDNNGAVGYDTVRISIVPANRPLIPAQIIPIGTLSQARSGVVIGAAGNKILFAGGTMAGGCASSQVDIYDIITNLWTTAQLSQARFGMGTSVLGNKIFFGGGFRPQLFPNTTTCYIGNSWYPETRSSAVDIYDASTNTWSTAQLNAPRTPQGASVGNKVLFAGGDEWSSSAFPSNLIDSYDGSTNSWTHGSLSESKGLPQIATSTNKLFLAGGATILDGDYFGGITKRIDIYDAVTGQWSQDFLSIERASMGSIGANNKIYWAGGVVANPDPNIIYEATSLVEIRDLVTNTTTFDCLSESRNQLTAIRKDNKIIFFGKNDVTTFDIYDLTTNSWSIGVLPQRFYSASVISHNNIIYMVGSHTGHTLSDQVWKLEF